MQSENPYSSPQSDPSESLKPRFKRHYEVEGNLLHVREGAMLPDVCLYSGRQGEGLPRSTKRLVKHPAWFYWVFALSFVAAIAFKRVGIAFVGIIILLLVTMTSRKTAIIHLAYSRSGLLIRTIGAGLGILLVPGVVRSTKHLSASHPMLYFLIVGISIYLAFAIVRKVGGFRVKRIHQGWVTLSGVHPQALETLKELKEDHPPERAGE